MSVRGVVQGVGFRPFVHRIATARGLGGWIRNENGGVTLCVEGTAEAVAAFTEAMRTEAPPLAVVEGCDFIDEPITCAEREFRIERSVATGQQRASVPADTHVCDACLAELMDPDDRRFRYPLINCTDCGPRFSIIRDTPYDRPLTTMADFTMCPVCQAEYDSVTDRRFHAQPNACATCGPRVTLSGHDGVSRDEDDAVEAAAKLLADGAVVAVKAHGGYQLMVDALNDEAVDRLRRRKERGGKAFAVLAKDTSVLKEYALVSDAEAAALESPARPIVLLRARPDSAISRHVAPGLSTLGAMLPSTPVQHLLLASGLSVLVATSGNAPGEPMATTAAAARRDLAQVCDAYLEHDRPIQSRVDDSIVRVVDLPDGPRRQVIRRARGHVPASITTPVPVPAVLALGAELKNTACLAAERQLVLSQHIGDLKSEGNLQFLSEAVTHLRALTGIEPGAVAHDLHPDFRSTKLAACQGLPMIGVQHHHAHMAACMLDNGLDEPVIGVIFDGTGLGTDGTVWGGEFLVGDYRGFERRGHLGQFRLPGGDKAVTEPDRVAVALLEAAFGADAVEHLDIAGLRGRDRDEREILLKMAARGVNSPLTSSAGRLFDGMSALLGVCSRIGYEAEAAIRLEELLDGDHSATDPWPTTLYVAEDRQVVDVRPWVRAVVESAGSHGAAEVSRRFHESLSHAVVEVCARLRRESGLDAVVLSGGVFLNRYLSVRVAHLLSQAGFRVYTHQQIPMTDGGISAGQAMVAGALLRERADAARLVAG
ncbi:carbamoyltransferase HypF [Streptomyces sp. NPDC007905]|uniref:carbamoyltransferase HypF n=1 Tax=Streptomyces sp. NPDC007905 TaxID=3364788 RepID=UPI0036E59A6A